MVKNKREMRYAMQLHEDFGHRSYFGFKRGEHYVLKHWNTEIAWIEQDGGIAMFDTEYYSNTTSGFQAMIIRNAMSEKGRAQLRELLGSDKLRAIRIEAGNY